MRLLVGAPVLRREWIIDQWMSHVLDAITSVEPLPEVAFLFVGGEDDPTFKIIDELTRAAQLTAHVLYVEEPRDFDHPNGLRKWEPGRYKRMTELRNILLGCVRELEPDYYLSVDTDILCHPLVIKNLIESSERFDAVGGRLYMTPKHNNAPSNMSLGRSSQRRDAEGVIKVDVIMALKLMTPVAYAIDYEYDRKGEDIGISRAWKRAGLKIGYDGRVASKHVMNRTMLHTIDPRIGW